MKILFKFPTRGRRSQFEEAMKSIFDNLYNREDFQILVSIDEDDPEMQDVSQYEYPNTIFFKGKSESKVDAINRDIEHAWPDWWQAIIVMSDDMRFSLYGFDQIIRHQFQEHGLDTLLHVPDQDAKEYLATMYIAGRQFYNRFGFVYNPEYKSLFCDNEVMEIAQKLGKYRYVDVPGLVVHLNPAYGHSEKDEMFIRQQEIGWSVDQETYTKRKANNFYL
jgi:hypothetical protein